jgi:hypothetical protein
MNNTLYWRTSNGGTYVDSFIGDDYNGDGTAQNPYQSLGRAWRGSSGKPGTITCRGYFAEDMADGNHAATIQGDYYGAAIFDGLSTYMLYGFRHTKMIIKNLPLSGDFSVNTRADLAGVGSASLLASLAMLGSTATPRVRFVRSFLFCPKQSSIYRMHWWLQ